MQLVSVPAIISCLLLVVGTALLSRSSRHGRVIGLQSGMVVGLLVSGWMVLWTVAALGVGPRLTGIDPGTVTPLAVFGINAALLGMAWVPFCGLAVIAGRLRFGGPPTLSAAMGAVIATVMVADLSGVRLGHADALSLGLTGCGLGLGLLLGLFATQRRDRKGGSNATA